MSFGKLLVADYSTVLGINLNWMCVTGPSFRYTEYRNVLIMFWSLCYLFLCGIYVLHIFLCDGVTYIF